MMPSNATLQYIASLGAALAAIAAIWKWIWPAAVSAYERMIAFRDSVEALPDTIRQVADIKEEVLATKAIACRVQQMVLPNGGSSLPDKIDAMRTAFDARGEVLINMGKEISALTNLQKAAQDTNTRMATFETGPDGKVTKASKTYARWTGMQVSDLLNHGWLNSIHPSDMTRVRGEFVSAIQDCRTALIDYLMLDQNHVGVKVEMTLTPVPDGANPCDSFFGSIARVEQDD